jgi:predicted transcriptional regulator
MTSERQVHRVRCTDIIIPERQRKKLGNLDSLGDSMQKEQNQPILLTLPTETDPKPKLVCGGRRLAVYIARKIEFIDAVYTPETDPIKLKRLEFAENDQRLDLTWQERCDAVVEIHKDLVARNGRGWTQKQTAEFLDVSVALVSEYLAIHELCEKGHTKLKEAADFGTARRMMRSINGRLEDAFDEGVAEICSDLIPGGYKITERIESPIITADFRERAPTYTGPKFNFIHCDFPFGINTEKRHQGEAPLVHGAYDDSPEVYWALLEVFCKNLDRFCADSAHVMFWFSMHNYSKTIAILSEHFKMDPFPLFWIKSDNKGLLPDPLRGPRRIYETALFGSRGDRKIVSPISNAFASPTDGSDHLSIKPQPVLQNFFRMFVNKDSKVLDPTCGSGSALRAAKALGAEYVLGIEKNKEFAERATREFEKWVRANGNGADPTADRPAV